MSFTNSLERVYRDTTYNIADTAAKIVNGDRIDDYLAEGGTSEDFLMTKESLDKYCISMGVSLVYLIKVDTSDYGSFTSVFNSVGEDTPYTPWEIGHKQDTTNETYAVLYKDIYENGKKSGTVYRTTKLNGAPPHITTLVPVKNSEGEVVGIMCIQRAMSELNEGRRPYLITIAVTTVLLSVIVALSWAAYIRKKFVNPLRRVLEETERFAKENVKGEELGTVSTINEISNLGHAVDEMEREMLDYIENLTSVTAEKERIGAELSVASIIQENSIPNIFPAFPEIKEFDIYASMDPAKEIGGDFYNFFLVDDEHLAFVIGDVSGKGIPAALFMMVTNILINDRTRLGGSPAEILTSINSSICEHNKADMFVTLWLGILDIKSGKITFANAGHDDAAVYRNGGEFDLFNSKHGLVVGAMNSIEYKNYEIQLDDGDKIFLYTDGVPEATDKDNRMFTVENMLKALNENKEKTPYEILGGVRKNVNDFVGDAPQFDDLTMLCIEYKKIDKKESLKVDATVENLERVVEFTNGFLDKMGCSMKAQTQIELSLEEAYVNIANYAYGDETGSAEIILDSEGDTAVITLKDSGTPYNPLEKADPDITLSAEERQIGGLGIFLVKKNMDDVSYKYEDGFNILTMKKTMK